VRKSELTREKQRLLWEEEELVKVYRSLSGEKRKQLGTYVKMLEEYSGRIDD